MHVVACRHRGLQVWLSLFGLAHVVDAQALSLRPHCFKSRAFAPCSPLGRSFLTGQIKSPADLAKDDFRATGQPRMEAGAFEQVSSQLV